MDNFFALWTLGFLVGVVGGFFGIGGASIVTPALNLLGFRMPIAIGTDLVHIFGKSVSATLKHGELGHLDWKIAVLLALGTIPGVEIAARLVFFWNERGIVDQSVRWIQMVVLGALALMVLSEQVFKRHGGFSNWRGFLARIPIPPYFDSPVSHLSRASVWGFIGLGLFTGFMAGMLGGGGGTVRVPAMIYLLGMPAKVAVGTDLIELLLSAGYGSFVYISQGQVDLLSALVMLFGGAFGARLGAMATFYSPSRQLRGLLGILLAASFLAVTMKQFRFGGTLLPLTVLGLTAFGIALFVLWILVTNLWVPRRLSVEQRR
ncbi:MAG: sulfite exporter TauE/SafE family protein [Armatimonadetes bacterium]|nr:sulfite exporter TauE/SafE family protein [Armatimonadota bacterium]MDW8122380.1 sulfite exporter TauE/SafE family protein [Armatimonadota bacterium]